MGSRLTRAHVGPAVAAASLTALFIAGSITTAAPYEPQQLTPRGTTIDGLAFGFRTSITERGGIITADYVDLALDPACTGSVPCDDQNLTVGVSGVLDFTGDEPETGEAAFDRGIGVVVSGDGCRILRARTQPIPGTPPSGPLSPARPSSLTLEDRCTDPGAGEVVVGDLDDADLDEVPTRMAMSHDGHMAAVGLGRPGGPSTIRHFQIGPIGSPSDVVATDLLLADGMGAFPVYGLDISDLGDVVVTIGHDDETRFDIVVWNPANGDTEEALQFLTESDGAFDGWAAYPGISGDGTLISFISALPLDGREEGIGPWAYVIGREDLAPRLVSEPAESAMFTSMSRDGSQVAHSIVETTEFSSDIECHDAFTFVRTAYVENVWTGGYREWESGCWPTRISVAIAESPEFVPSTVERVVEVVALPGPDDVQGRFEPRLSGNGRWISWTNFRRPTASSTPPTASRPIACNEAPASRSSPSTSAACLPALPPGRRPR